MVNLLSTADIFSIPVYLLETVELELEAHWTRDMKLAFERTKSAMGKLPYPLERMSALQLPSDAEAIASYKAAAAEMKTALALREASFPETSLKELFEMAINYEHPFAAEGKNFQDAIILESVIDFSKRAKLRSVALVSKNHSDFDSNKVKKRAAANGIELQYFRDLDALHDSLWPLVSDLLKKRRREENERAKAGLSAISLDLEKFLRSQLVRSDDVHLSLLNIDDVKVAWWDKITQKLERVPVQIAVNAAFSHGAFRIDRGIMVDGWVVGAQMDYERFEFDSATITR